MENFVAPNVQLGAIAPEIALVVTALLVLVVHAFVGDRIDSIYLPVTATLGLVPRSSCA